MDMSDVAQMNFMMNTMRGMGTGGAMGGGGLESPLGADFGGFDNQQQKFRPAFGFTLGSQLVGATQGFMQQVDLNMFSQLSPTISPMAGKMPGLLSGRG